MNFQGRAYHNKTAINALNTTTITQHVAAALQSHCTHENHSSSSSYTRLYDYLLLLITTYIFYLFLFLLYIYLPIHDTQDRNESKLNPFIKEQKTQNHCCISNSKLYEQTVSDCATTFTYFFLFVFSYFLRFVNINSEY